MKTKDQAYVSISQQLPLDEKLLKRLDRAKNDVLSYGYDVLCIGIDADGAKLYQISKASTTLLEDTSKSYEVTHSTCTCPDYPEARAGLCKHRLAIMILEEMEKE